MADELPGNVQDAIAKAPRLAHCVLSIERQELCEDHDVVGCQGELNRRGVGGEGVEGQVRGASGLECLDAVLDLGLGAVEHLQGGKVLAVLVGDQALEAMAVEV